MMNERMSKLNKLANQVNKTEDKDMKRIWTNQWYKLVRQYGTELTTRRENEEKKKEITMV
jgi:cytochrome c